MLCRDLVRFGNVENESEDDWVGLITDESLINELVRTSGKTGTGLALCIDRIRFNDRVTG